MTIAVLERLGDRILRSVLPQEKAAACGPVDQGTYSQWQCGPGGWCGEDNMYNTCNGARGCRYWGSANGGYDYTVWNGPCG
jgi:hypothetical protein